MTMRAIEITAPGGPEALSLCKRPTPEPSHGEVLIKVSAAGVNRPDILQRQGLYPAPKGATDLPGLEVSGHIKALGPGVTEWKQGDRVCALVNGGGYAEYCIAPLETCLPIPEGLTLQEAAGLPETYFTVWSNLVDLGQIKRGERLLVHGGSSGIGVAAIQLGRFLGADIFATVGTPEKVSALETLGAKVINYQHDDFKTTLSSLTQGKGMDIILDMVGGDYLGRNIELLTYGGRLLIIGLLGGSQGELDLNRVLTRRLRIEGSTLRRRTLEERKAIRDALLHNVWPQFGTLEFRPIMDRCIPFTEASKAHTRMESSQHIGKIVLTMETY